MVRPVSSTAEPNGIIHGGAIRLNLHEGVSGLGGSQCTTEGGEGYHGVHHRAPSLMQPNLFGTGSALRDGPFEESNHDRCKSVWMGWTL